MKFRLIYWVTEQLDASGRSQVTGVYTSVPDLVERGLHWHDGCDKMDGFRLSLVQLDSGRLPLGCWSSPAFGDIGQELEAYVTSQELTVHDRELLLERLSAL